MARRATSLGPNPPYLFFCFCFVFGFLFVFFVAFCFLFGSFLCFLQKNPVFPPTKGIFGLFSVFLFLPPLTFLASPFSASLSLSLFCSCLSFFLLVFLFLAFFLFLLCLFFHCSFFFAFVSWIEQHENIKLQFLFHQYGLLFFWFPVLFSLWNLSLSSLCFFLILSYVFVQHHCFLVSKNPSWKTPIWVKRGLQHNGFFMNLCFAKCGRLSFLGGAFFGKFWLFFKKTLWKLAF